MTLKTKTAISAVFRGKSNTSSGKLNTTIGGGPIPKPSTAIPKTPQSSNKLKMLSAKKPRSINSNSMIEDAGLVGAFTSKRHHLKQHSMAGVNENNTSSANSS